MAKKKGFLKNMLSQKKEKPKKAVLKPRREKRKIKPLMKRKPIKKLIMPKPSKGKLGTRVTMPPLHKKLKHYKKKPLGKIKEFMKTGIEGLDTLLEKGVPKGASVLLAGGAGSGKTIMGLQVINNLCKEGKKCLYMSFEESEERLREHMSDFGWDARAFADKKI